MADAGIYNFKEFFDPIKQDKNSKKNKSKNKQKSNSSDN